MAAANPTTRRSLFAIAGAAALVPAVAMAAPAPTHADAELIALGLEDERLHAAYEAASAVRSEAFRRLQAMQPTPPPELIIKRMDVWDFFGDMHLYIGKEADDYVVRRVKTWLASEHLRAWNFKRVEDRAHEIIAAYERHAAAVTVAEHRSGLTRACQVEDDAYEALSDNEDRIMALPCRTLEGARIKARLARRNIPEDTKVSGYVRHAMEVVDFVLRGAAH